MRWFYIGIFFTVVLFIAFLWLLNKQDKPKLEAIDGVVDNIVVEKSQRVMYLREKDKILRQYKIALGTNPVGAKHQMGDGKTPEGQYYISGRNPRSSFHLSLRISYPNEQDKAWAKEHNVPAGGDIMIHGFPNKAVNALFKYVHRTDWTAGCIAVTDEEIEQIWQAVKDGTPILIKP